jgi:hypothetical protein
LRTTKIASPGILVIAARVKIFSSSGTCRDAVTRIVAALD